MATNTSTRSRAKKTELETESVQEQTVAAGAVAERPVKEVFRPIRLDPNQYVTVRNGFQGRLVYDSRKTGERYVWDQFGEDQEMELAELKSARSAHKKFFSENWFMFDDPEVIAYLGVQQYYKNAIPIDEFGELFNLSNKEMVAKISKMSRGQKQSAIYLAKEKIADGSIDSRQKIAALEEALGTQLVER